MDQENPNSISGELIGGELAEHALRRELVREFHARPFERLIPPVRASHLLLVDGDQETDSRALAALCTHFDLPPPDTTLRHYSAESATGMRVKWERHTEFTSLTFFECTPFAQPFEDPVINRVPRDWLARLPGTVLSALHIAVDDQESPERPFEEWSALFANNTVTGAVVSGGRARAWTDQQIHSDGFGRVLIRDDDLNSRSTGRTVQRLIEIHDYRMMAMLAFPVARRYGNEIAQIEQTLAAVTERLTSIGDIESEQELLDQITALAARTAQIAAASDFRFSASRAYAALVNRRIGDLRESRIEGLQTFRDFHDRRLAPAMATCESVAQRQQDLSERIARASDLLRTRVDVALERQNRDLLASMDRRAKLQLRLQETVEGLSVVVLTYYLVGLVSYVLKGLKAGGAAIDATLLTGIAAPVVFAGVFWMLRQARKRLNGGG